MRNGIRIPKILEERERAIVEEHIDGTLLDDVGITKDLVSKVLKELKRIHEIPASAVPFLPGRGKCLIYGDATGDNIILDRDGNIWFIDWSSARKGFPETDIRKFRRWLRTEARRTNI